MNLSEEAPVVQGAGRSARLGRRLLIRFGERDYSELEALAARSSMSRGSMVRHLIELGRRTLGGTDGGEARLIALAGLVAAEHTRLYIEAMLPQGKGRSMVLAEAAVDAAQERLASLSDEAREG